MECCAHCRDTADLFDQDKARHELRDYRTAREPAKTSTRRLVGGLKTLDLEGRTLLDVGGGIGTIPFELLEAGVEEATLVETSPAYLEVARREAERRGYGEETSFHRGDVVEMEDELPEFEIVTLDRVICCYPDLDALVRTTAGRARRWYGVVYPKERLYTEAIETVANAYCWSRGDDFRLHVHENVDETIRRCGFHPFYDTTTLLWRITLYERRE